jgi:heptosyltransferase-2
MALIANARVVLSNDTGLMHVAAALGKPQIAIFGSSSPEHTPPLNPHAQVIWLKKEHHKHHNIKVEGHLIHESPHGWPACMPCFERVCRYGHTACLHEITPERVWLEWKKIW